MVFQLRVVDFFSCDIVKHSQAFVLAVGMQTCNVLQMYRTLVLPVSQFQTKCSKHVQKRIIVDGLCSCSILTSFLQINIQNLANHIHPLVNNKFAEYIAF